MGVGLSNDELRETIEAVLEHGSASAAARALGVNRVTFQKRVEVARKKYPDALPDARFDNRGGWATGEPTFTSPSLPDEGAPVDELIAARVRAFERKHAAKEARQLIPVKVNIDGAYGLIHFGDPHIDDDGCDWPTLQHHLDLVDRTEGLFAINSGDSQNNWVGRLARLYANQSTTASDAIRLVEWLIGRVKWLAIIGGNHDAWSGAGDPVRWFARNAGSLYEWHGLRLALQSPNGCEIRLNARHDFAGTSQWNGAHAPAKAARMGWNRDHLYTCGHRHAAAYNMLVFDNGAHIAHAIRVGTYKVYDDFAESKGFPRENLPACLTVHNPNAKTASGLVTVFWDVDEGADYLRFLRRPRVRVKAA